MKQKSVTRAVNLLFILALASGLMSVLSATAWAGSNISVGKIWYVGDEFRLQEDDWLYYNESTSIVDKIGPYAALDVPAPSYDKYGWKQWVFRNAYRAADGDLTSLYFDLPDGKEESDVPIGFKLISGTGKRESPYRFALVYNHKHGGQTATEWKETSSLPSAAGCYCLENDVTISNTWNIPAGKTINLCLNGHGIRLNTDKSDTPVISIPETSTLNLYNCYGNKHYITIKNWRGRSDNFYGNEKAPDANGDGVVKVYGGYITGGNGGDNGGAVYSKGTFNMYGGTIVGNFATNGGAGVRAEKGEFNLYGGNIRWNTAHLAGGVRVKDSAMTMSGGTISDNYAKNTGSHAIDEGNGGGIYIGTDNGTVNIRGGSIVNNRASFNGGAVYYTKGTLNISGNPDISGNKKDSKDSQGRDDSNIYLDDQTKINITGKLNNTNPIGIMGSSSVPLTNGLRGRGGRSNFKADNNFTEYGTALTSDGELMISTLRKVSINTEGPGTITVKNGEDVVASGTEVAEGTALSISAEAEEGYELSGKIKLTYGDTTKQIENGGTFTTPGSYDISVSASFTKITPKVFNVTFMDGQGKTLKTEIVEKGKSATAPAAPTRKGYTFDGWDTDFSNVKSDLTVTAKWKQDIVYYDVIFEDGLGNVISSQKVAAGRPAAAPAAPGRTGYVFSGWDKDFSKITADLTVRALWTKESKEEDKYTVAFVFGFGNRPLILTVAKGGSAEAPDTVPKVEGFTFKGWDKDFSRVTSNLTVTAQWSKNTAGTEHTVVFVDGFSPNPLRIQRVKDGQAATAPQAPVREGYVFTGWDTDFSYVTENLTVIARWKQNESQDQDPSSDPQPEPAPDDDSVKKAAEEIAGLPADPAAWTREQTSGARALIDSLTDSQKEQLGAEILQLEKAEYYWAKTDAEAKKANLKSVKTVKGKKAVVKWNKVSGTSGYRLEYSTGRKFTKKTTKKITTKSNKSVRKLKAGKTYYFRIRTYTSVYNPVTEKNENVAGKWSNVKKIKSVN